MMPETVYENIEGWPWQPNLCPADEEFIDWCKIMATGNRVFHMGTGLHHEVGKYLESRGVFCLGLTASKAEFESIRHDEMFFYSVLLDNLNHVAETRNEFAKYSIMTLFHLGEMPGVFGDIDTPLIRSLIKDCVMSAGLVAAYRRSSAWDRARTFFRNMEAQGVLRRDSIYKDLIFYRRL